MAFAARGWMCDGVDLVSSPLPAAATFFTCADILDLTPEIVKRFDPDFIVASPPCEQFSIHGMKHFHPKSPYPELGIRLFNHTRALCEASGVPYVIENVKAAQQFVGDAVHHCGPFYLWGTMVPPLLPQGIRKNMVMGNSKLVNELKRNGDREALKQYRRQFDLTWNSSKSKARKEATAKAATIPPELANCVAAYAERILYASHGTDRTDSRASHDG
jgi:hypothetical protein